jgi:hypothetical protein
MELIGILDETKFGLTFCIIHCFNFRQSLHPEKLDYCSGDMVYLATSDKRHLINFSHFPPKITIDSFPPRQTKVLPLSKMSRTKKKHP